MKLGRLQGAFLRRRGRGYSLEEDRHVDGARFERPGHGTGPSGGAASPGNRAVSGQPSGHDGHHLRHHLLPDHASPAEEAEEAEVEENTEGDKLEEAAAKDEKIEKVKEEVSEMNKEEVDRLMKIQEN